MKKHLRLLLFEACNRKCRMCCNKSLDLQSLPVVQSFSEYELIMLTGGEPLLRPHVIAEAVGRIRQETKWYIPP